VLDGGPMWGGGVRKHFAHCGPHISRMADARELTFCVLRPIESWGSNQKYAKVGHVKRSGSLL